MLSEEFDRIKVENRKLKQSIKEKKKEFVYEIEKEKTSRIRERDSLRSLMMKKSERSWEGSIISRENNNNNNKNEQKSSSKEGNGSNHPVGSMDSHKITSTPHKSHAMTVSR